PPRPSPTLFPYTTLFRSLQTADVTVQGISDRGIDEDQVHVNLQRGRLLRLAGRIGLGVLTAACSSNHHGRKRHQQKRSHDESPRSEEHTSELQSLAYLVC